MTTPTPDDLDLLARIAGVTADDAPDRCVQCRGPLPKGSDSTTYCSDRCQAAWTAAAVGAVPLPDDYEEPALVGQVDGEAVPLRERGDHTCPGCGGTHDGDHRADMNGVLAAHPGRLVRHVRVTELTATADPDRGGIAVRLAMGVGQRVARVVLYGSAVAGGIVGAGAAALTSATGPLLGLLVGAGVVLVGTAGYLAGRAAIGHEVRRGRKAIEPLIARYNVGISLAALVGGFLEREYPTGDPGEDAPAVPEQRNGEQEPGDLAW